MGWHQSFIVLNMLTGFMPWYEMHVYFIFRALLLVKHSGECVFNGIRSGITVDQIEFLEGNVLTHRIIWVCNVHIMKENHFLSLLVVVLLLNVFTSNKLHSIMIIKYCYTKMFTYWWFFMCIIPVTLVSQLLVQVIYIYIYTVSQKKLCKILSVRTSSIFYQS